MHISDSRILYTAVVNKCFLMRPYDDVGESGQLASSDSKRHLYGLQCKGRCKLNSHCIESLRNKAQDNTKMDKIAKTMHLLSLKPIEMNKTINYLPGEKNDISHNHTKKRPQFHAIVFE